MRQTTFYTTLLLLLLTPWGNVFSQIIQLPNEFTGPVVSKDLEDIVDPDTSSTLVIDLREHFELSNVKGQVVQFDSNLGKINLELFDANTPYNKPVTVANFLNLVTNNDYNNSIIHRSVTNFIIQGGRNINTQGGSPLLTSVRAVGPIINEPGISNTVGTIAMAKLANDPDSATNQWFFNLGDNSANLDNQNGGFTVFGRVIGNSMTVVNAIAALTPWNLLQIIPDGALGEVPLFNFDNTSPVTAENFVTFTTISTIDIYPAEETSTAVLSFQFSNSKENLLTVKIVGSELHLDFNPGQTGQAEITVAVFDTHSLSAESTFLVTVNTPVETDVFGGTDISGFPGWKSSPWYRNYNIENWPWIFHDEHGWQFVSENSTANVIFLFDLGLQEWVFLNANTYRWQFLFSDTPGWIWTFGDNTPNRRFFQRLDDGSLFSIPPDD